MARKKFTVYKKTQKMFWSGFLEYLGFSPLDSQKMNQYSQQQLILEIK